jgi:hypothetical protein
MQHEYMITVLVQAWPCISSRKLAQCHAQDGQRKPLTRKRKAWASPLHNAVVVMAPTHSATHESSVLASPNSVYLRLVHYSMQKKIDNSVTDVQLAYPVLADLLFLNYESNEATRCHIQ